MFQGNQENLERTVLKPEIDYQFIVVYEKFNKKVANSIKQQAVTKGVRSTIWSETDYGHNEANLTNYNHVLFLSEKLINETLSNPKLEEHELVPSVYYKTEGNSFGIYAKVKCARECVNDLKKVWRKFLSPVSLTVLSLYLFLDAEKRYKLPLLFEAVDSFINKHLEAWISHS